MLRRVFKASRHPALLAAPMACFGLLARRRSRAAGMGLAAILAVAAGVIAFTATRNARDGGPVASAGGEFAQDGRPDTSAPGWALPIKEQEAAKPRYTQTINSIRLVPCSGDAPMSTCKPGEAEYAPEEVADSSRLAVRPSALPAGAAIDPAFTESVRCAGQVTLVERFYIIPHAPGAPELVASGRASWFDVEHGGQIWITRMRLRGPAWDGSEVPSDQWSSATVGGLPAAVGQPVLPGFGRSSVVVWDAKSGILTIIRANDRLIEEVLVVAEELVK